MKGMKIKENNKNVSSNSNVLIVRKNKIDFIFKDVS